jgi:hypothetical protein
LLPEKVGTVVVATLVSLQGKEAHCTVVQSTCRLVLDALLEEMFRSAAEVLLAVLPAEAAFISTVAHPQHRIQGVLS